MNKYSLTHLPDWMPLYVATDKGGDCNAFRVRPVASTDSDEWGTQNSEDSVYLGKNAIRGNWKNSLIKVR